MSESNALSRPLGTNTPLPGGDIIDTPPGGGGNVSTNAGGPPPGAGIGDQPSPDPSARSFDGTRRTLMEQHLRYKAAYAASGKALKQLDHIRKGLERLSDKQDIVTMEDVIEEAGKLVAHGIDPIALAGLLADAPQEGGGEALGGWVAGHAQTAAQAEQQMIANHNLFRHEMGVSAIHLLMAHATAQHMLGGIAPPMGQGSEEDTGNTLSPDPNAPPPQETPGDYTPANALAHGRRFMRS